MEAKTHRSRTRSKPCTDREAAIANKRKVVNKAEETNDDISDQEFFYFYTGSLMHAGTRQRQTLTQTRPEINHKDVVMFTWA